MKCILTISASVVYIILGHHYEHVGLMLSLKQKGLLDKGEYFVVGIDIEQYDAMAPDKYLRGLLQDKTDDDCIIAFNSYLGIVPSPPSNFDEFARQVITIGLMMVLTLFFRHFCNEKNKIWIIQFR